MQSLNTCCYASSKHDILWTGGRAMCNTLVNIPDEVLYDTKMSKEEANDFAKKAVALMMYKMNKVSLGYCA